MKYPRFRSVAAPLLAVLAVTLVAGCKTAANPVPAGITVDTNSFVLHNFNQYPTQNANDLNNTIAVFDVTYTNHDPIPQAMSPSHFVLIDQTTLAQYRALDGGDIHVPVFGYGGLLDPGKSIDVSVAFRVPATMALARLSYSP